VVARQPLRLVTSNRGKYLEARAILEPYGIDLTWTRRRLMEPQAETLTQVTQAKLAAADGVATPFLVEDAGLFIDALAGFPGVYSAPMLQLWGLERILRLVPPVDRRATFRAVAGLRTRSGVRLFHGACPGRIGLRARGRQGFGYDPIFIPEGSDRTFAEMAPEAKNVLSHRARALRRVGAFLAHS